MSIRKNLSRTTVWSAIDAADATISNAQYADFQTAYEAAQADADQGILDAAAAQSDIDDLELKSDIIASISTNNTAAVVAHGAMPSTVGTIKVVDANGDVVGYAPLYENEDLS